MLSDFGCMLSVGVIHFEDRLCVSKKVEIEKGGTGLGTGSHVHGSCLGWL